METEPKLDIDVSQSFGELFDVLGTIWHYGWWLIIAIFLYIALQVWVYFRQIKYARSLDYVLLSIAIPAENDHGPEFMEQIFAGIHAIEKSRNFVEKYWEGQFQEAVSFEIVGISGYVRFLVRVPDFHRNTMESIIYANYPDAEIQEVDDYVEGVPSTYPNEEYDFFGFEAVLTKPDAYPIFTYSRFAEDISEGGYADPISTLTESMGSLQPGEQIWYQVICQPRWDFGWVEEGEKLIDKLMKRPVEKKTPLAIRALHAATPTIGEAEAGAEEDASLELLSPGEREVVKAIEENISKIGFNAKIRFAYVGKKDVFNKPKGVTPPFSFLRIFTSQTINGLKPNTKNWTSVDYFKKWRLPRRQRLLCQWMKDRDLGAGCSPYTFNIEELATIYHFPFSSVKTPTLQRTAAKAGEPPTDLPQS